MADVVIPSLEILRSRVADAVRDGKPIAVFRFREEKLDTEARATILAEFEVLLDAFFADNIGNRSLKDQCITMVLRELTPEEK